MRIVGMPSHRPKTCGRHQSASSGYSKIHIFHGLNGETRNGKTRSRAGEPHHQRTIGRVRVAADARADQKSKVDLELHTQPSFFRVFPFLPWIIFFPPANCEWPIAECDVVLVSE
jgi:hypothetical protein